jgi:hypothetical protein
MRRFFLLLNILLAFGLTGYVTTASGQSLTYPVIGIFSDHNEVFKGTVRERSLGDSQILMQGQDTGLTCTVFYRPVSIAPNVYDCAGLGGECFGTCDDGRKFQGVWKATSCWAGVANATDQNGNRVTFVYGYHYTASQSMGTLKLADFKKPDLPLLYADRCSLDR